MLSIGFLVPSGRTGALDSPGSDGVVDQAVHRHRGTNCDHLSSVVRMFKIGHALEAQCIDYALNAIQCMKSY